MERIPVRNYTEGGSSLTLPTEPGAHSSSPGRVRLLLWIGFGGLLLLMAFIGVSAVSFLYQIEVRQSRMQSAFVERDRALESLRSDIYLSGTYLRDFLLDTDSARAEAHRRAFLESRRRIVSGEAGYRRLVRPPDLALFEQFSREIDSYFAVLTPALEWNSDVRRSRGSDFVREQVHPRRLDVLALSDRMQQVSQRQLEASSREIGELFSRFRMRLLIMFLVTAAIGILLASVILRRILRLERESRSRFEEVVRARGELRLLSAELVSAQEKERRRIARELHDEIGQGLWAMMLNLASVRSLLEQRQWDEALLQLDRAHLTGERNAATIRNLSLLLRPSILDDLGLIPALRWLARELSRTSPLHVNVVASGFEDSLPDEYKTCVYRVVQEALRNVSRHARATEATVEVNQVRIEPDTEQLRVSIEDNGQGFDPARDKGMGILGMEERVAALGGVLQIISSHGSGAKLALDIPLPRPLKKPDPSALRTELTPEAYER